jgi:5-methylcytosine-specific restriction endonuclease McrA
MEFVLNCLNAARSIRSVINHSSPLSAFAQDVALSKKQQRDRRHQSQTRLRVLRRDHYRCRGCDKTGDEVTLEIHQIQSDSFDPEGLITLCTTCQALVERWRLSADQIPDLLRQLWAHLYPRRGYNAAVETKIIRSSDYRLLVENKTSYARAPLTSRNEISGRTMLAPDRNVSVRAG